MQYYRYQQVWISIQGIKTNNIEPKNPPKEQGENPQRMTKTNILPYNHLYFVSVIAFTRFLAAFLLDWWFTLTNKFLLMAKLPFKN